MRQGAFHTMVVEKRDNWFGQPLSSQKTFLLPPAIMSRPSLASCRLMDRVLYTCGSLAQRVQHAPPTSTRVPTPPSTHTIPSLKVGPPLTPTASSHKSRARTFRHHPLPRRRHRYISKRFRFCPASQASMCSTKQVGVPAPTGRLPTRQSANSFVIIWIVRPQSTIGIHGFPFLHHPKHRAARW